MSEQDRAGKFFLKRRGKRGTFYVCWFDAALKQTRGITTKTADPEEARGILREHSVLGRKVFRTPTFLDGCELLQSAGTGLLDAERIIELALGRRDKTGIYFLIRGASVAYVGQSTRARSRVLEHAREGLIQFDRYLILPCKKEDLLTLERRYIAKLSPACNVPRGRARDIEKAA